MTQHRGIPEQVVRPASKIAKWANDDLKEKTMRELHRQFITQAFAQL